MFPPQARGWTPMQRAVVSLRRVSPAGAGMDPRGCSRCSPRSCFPRRRGDGPPPAHLVRRQLQFPPQARGWTPIGRAVGVSPDVSPAGAGMDRSGRRCSPTLSSFPRRRGDGPGGAVVAGELDAFPPQARGWTPSTSSRATRSTVSPAGAGMDLPLVAVTGDGDRFPRRRGDGPATDAERRADASFPRRRGDGPVSMSASAFA